MSRLQWTHLFWSKRGLGRLLVLPCLGPGWNANQDGPRAEFSGNPFSHEGAASPPNARPPISGKRFRIRMNARETARRLRKNVVRKNRILASRRRSPPKRSPILEDFLSRGGRNTRLCALRGKHGSLRGTLSSASGQTLSARWRDFRSFGNGLACGGRPLC